MKSCALAQMDLLDALALLPAEWPGITLGFAIALGLLFGSFANVAIYRLPRNCLSIVKPASHCPACKTPIRWYDNIPILAWLLWLGRACRACKAPIHWRYPLVEAICGAWFGLLAWQLLVIPSQWAIPLGSNWLSAASPQHWALVGVWGVAGVALLVASWIDAQMQIIPDEISVGGTIVMFLIAPLLPLLHRWGVPAGVVADPLLFSGVESEWLRAWLTTASLMAVAGGCLWLIGLAGYLVNRKEAIKEGGGMGLGDVKLVMLMAGLLGWPKLALAFVLAVVSGAVFGMPKLIRKWRGDESASSVISFGPYLALGTALAMVASPPCFALVEWYLDLLRQKMGG